MGYKFKIYYEDTDVGGVVYHANYIKYCERARSEMFYTQNYPLVQNNSHFMVTEIHAKYLKPAFLGDEIIVSANVSKIKRASFLVKQEIKRGKDLLFIADISIVFTKDGKPIRMPQSLLEFLEKNM